MRIGPVLIRPANSTDQSSGKDLVGLRAAGWREFELRWRWLQDSYEGGNRYRQAIYGSDSRGLPIRNLIRHKREYPDQRELMTSHAGFQYSAGVDPASSATDDDYEMRRARTPAPDFLAEAIGSHLARIYSREVKREGPDELKAWWDDVDGAGTSIDDWMQQTLAPLLLTCGQVDVYLDHPVADGPVVSQADVKTLALDSCVASYILPENVLWWRLDGRNQKYQEVLVREYLDDDGKGGKPEYQFRLWTTTGWALLDEGGEVKAVGQHAFGEVPIRREFTGRKPRCCHIGVPQYEAIAEYQREFYNRDSELILSDTTQAHPLLQGPEDYVQADGTIPIGPSWLLPKKKNTLGSTATYEGFDIVDFPKGAADSIRTNKQDLRDAVDRSAGLIKPAGSTGGTVSQSGVSKQIDRQSLHDRLARVAGWLTAAERSLAELALVVLHNGDQAKVKAALEQTTIAYPATFEIDDPETLAASLAAIQQAVSDAGDLPLLTAAFVERMVRNALPGYDDATYDEWVNEITAAVSSAKDREDEMNLPSGPEMSNAGVVPAGVPTPDTIKEGSDDSAVVSES